MKRIIKGSLLVIVAAFALWSCKGGNNLKGDAEPDFNLLDSLVEAGDFAQAKEIIYPFLEAPGLSQENHYHLNFEIDKMERIANEFNLSIEDALEYIHKYLPEAGENELNAWIESGALEAKKIDGAWRVFKKAPHNLFLIDTAAAKAYVAVEGVEEETSDFLEGYLPQVLEASAKSKVALSSVLGIQKQNVQKASYVKPQKMRIHVRMRVFPQAVPAGETVRIWLPFIHWLSPKYTYIKLLNVYRSDNATPDNPQGNGASEYILSPSDAVRNSLYAEMISNGTDTLKIGYDLEFTALNQYFANLEDWILPYDFESDLYKKYTAEREQHIVFTPELKKLTAEIVGEEVRPYQIVKKIWSYIDKNFPWAGARDYSTIPNIPMYVLKNGHGDCGQVTLLLLTMLRIAGIPAKWQSGWMLHPGHVNLHDWGEVYYEGVGWVPIDQSFGHNGSIDNPDQYYFFSRGLDAYRYIVNEDYGAAAPLYPAKIYPHFDEVDFQMGEVEWRGGNVYNGSNGWRCWMDVEYLN